MTNWTDIHPDFAKKERSWKQTYQQVWEENNLTYQDAQEWIVAGFEPLEYEEVKNWKSQNFTPQEAKPWIEVGLDKDDYEFASYLRWKNIQPNQDLEWFRTEWWLDKNYPIKERKNITELEIKGKNLEGNLDLKKFVNLVNLNCRDNRITSSNLNLSDCRSLTILFCPGNQLTSAQFLNQLPFPEKLVHLSLNHNNIQPTKLNFLKNFINLGILGLGNNSFYGSLEPLKNMNKLWLLDISNTDIDSGLEYLPESITRFDYYENPRAKVKVIYNLFADENGKVELDENGTIKNFPQKLKEYKEKLTQGQQSQEIAKKAELTNEEFQVLQKENQQLKAENNQLKQKLESKNKLLSQEIAELEAQLKNITQQIYEVAQETKELNQQLQIGGQQLSNSPFLPLIKEQLSKNELFLTKKAQQIEKLQEKGKQEEKQSDSLQQTKIVQQGLPK